MGKVNAFDVFSHMVETDDKAITMAALGNITELRKVKAGTNVTIGVAGDVVGSIYNGKYVGGLILCDKKRFDEVKAELERHPQQERSEQTRSYGSVRESEP
jgi:hypothetical protein